MADTVTATTTELPESRVRVEVQVPPPELRRAMDRAASAFGRNLRLPGFRTGKVPAALVIQRVGREAILDEAVRSTLGRWYVDALDCGGVEPVGEPEIDLGDLPGEGESLAFSFEIGVRPKATLGEYKGVEAPRGVAQADPQAIDEQIAQLRERLARLETADRPAMRGDFVVIDYSGAIDGDLFEGGTGADQLVELGGGRLVPGFEEQLEGVGAGQAATVNVTFPAEYPVPHLAGCEAEFAVTVKEVKAKVLPQLDDDFANNAAGFDTLAELREDIAAKLREADEERVVGEYREAVLDAVVANATITVPEAIATARARELWERLLQQIGHQGITKEAYLRMAAETEDEIVAQARPDAEQALRREAVIAAVIEAEGIEVSDGDILDTLQESAVTERTTPEKLRKRLAKAGRLDDLREDIAQRRAVDLLVDHATSIDVGLAAAREKLWTPDQRS